MRKLTVEDVYFYIRDTEKTTQMVCFPVSEDKANRKATLFAVSETWLYFNHIKNSDTMSNIIISHKENNEKAKKK